MRTLLTSLTLFLPTAFVLVGACADTETSCEDTLSCSGDTTTGGGTAGTTGLGGTEGGGSGGTVATDATSTTGQGGTSGTSSTTGGGEGGDPGVGGAAGAGGSPPMCEGELLPGDDACVVDEEYGVFVAPGGDDTTGDGTREAPFATLQKAADAASDSGKRVYACATSGDYPDALSLTEAHDGLELYGSFDCSDWSYGGDLRANVAPDTGVALSVSEIETSLELDGFTFESADATTPGASSIAAEIRSSAGVVLRNVALRAGAGATGASGVTANFTYPDKSELDGVAGSAESGGVMPVVSCPAGETTRGGPGGFPAGPTDGSVGTPNHEGPGGEGGTVGADCGIGGTGARGADGPAGPDGSGATTLGALDDGRWVAAGGSDGGHGLPGQGGGGGAGAANGGGGSGGAGGCGGAGGKAGGGGGASIALLLVDAELTLVDSQVAAADAGDGGAGSSGQEGQQEFGSFGAGEPDGCPGGRGGLGGNGGAGGGGAGGISVGILVQGTAPTLTNTGVTVGSEGFAGDGPGASNDGVLGLAQPELNLSDL